MTATIELAQLAKIICELFGESPNVQPRVFSRRDEASAVATVAGWKLLLHERVGVNRKALVRYREQVSRLPQLDPRAIDVLVVPAMPSGLAELCVELCVHWLDPAGNCDIRAPGLRLYVRGRKPVVEEKHRQPGLISPKSLRFLRAIAFGDDSLQQREAARLAGVDEGQASRITHQLLDAGPVEKRDDGAIRVVRMEALLDLLAAGVAERGAPTGIVGRVDASAAEPAWRTLAERCDGVALTYAVSGPVAAGLLLGHAPEPPCRLWVVAASADDVARQLGFRRDDDGDVVLCVREDRTRVEGRRMRDGVWVAHPGQVYADCLKEAVAPATLEELRRLAAERPESTGDQ